MRLSWLPWKFVIRKLARAHGFLDPITIWSYFQKFAQPSEVAGPIELIRDSAVFHARGLINCRAIPQNQDWVWPWWINQQFNPENPTFIPRAFSLTYVNLTHRNWTAVGQPDCPYYPLTDPAGLVTPHLDSWSIDFFLVDKTNHLYAPSRLKHPPKQRIQADDSLCVETSHDFFGDVMTAHTRMVIENGRPFCQVKIHAEGMTARCLIVSVRPYNPEGISFVHEIEYDPNEPQWTVNGKDFVRFSPRAGRHYLSEYRHGDVLNLILEGRAAEARSIECDVGLATAAAVFSLEEEPGDIELRIPLDTRKPDVEYTQLRPGRDVWHESLDNTCKLTLPNEKKQFLYDTALRSVLLHTNPEEVYPGPFTYKKFWFRDATFILYSLLCANHFDRVRTILDTYPHKQKLNGYFQSQQGEWDSNGQAIWIMDQFLQFADEKPNEKWVHAIEKAANWILRKCTDPNSGGSAAGLLPAGFSAEHFGPNDYYYWDDYWAVAGLRSAARIETLCGAGQKAKKYIRAADKLETCIEKSIEKVQETLNVKSIPVSCNRRMDSAAIGSLACRYPAQIYEAGDKRLMATADYLYHHHCFKNGFLLNVSHSGINAYLTLHLAQVFMQAGDARFVVLEDEITRLASPTGQWPEAIHPQTEAGCMGDGQHIWAAAEWITFMRNSLLFEDFRRDELVLGAGIHPDWTKPGHRVSIGPAASVWGTLSVEFLFEPGRVKIRCLPRWYQKPSAVRIAVPCFEETTIEPDTAEISIMKKGSK